MPLAFVTGATGFVGSHLCQQLTMQGWHVVALCRDPARPAFIDTLPVTKVRGDLDDGERLKRLIPPGVDAVFHVAGDTSIWPRERARQVQTNVIGTRHVVAAALAVGARRFVHTSSIAAFGIRADCVDEQSALLGRRAPVHYYRTKAMAEDEVQSGIARGLNATFINPCHVLGPLDTTNWSRMFRLLAARKLPGVPPGSGMFVDVREVAKAHVAAARVGQVGRHYLLGGEETSFLALLQEAGRQLGVPVPARPLPAALVYLAGAGKELVAALTGRPPDLSREGARIVCSRVRCDSQPAIAELGYKPAPVPQLVADTLAWLRANGALPVPATVARRGLRH